MLCCKLFIWQFSLLTQIPHLWNSPPPQPLAWWLEWVPPSQVPFFPSRHLVSCLPDFSDEQRIAFKVGIMPVQQHNGKPIFHHSTFDAVIVAF